MEYNINDFKLSEDEFNSLSTIEKRNCIIQSNVEETNWWVRTAAKIYVIGFFTYFFLLYIFNVTNN